jgi:hypothetical protein
MDMQATVSFRRSQLNAIAAAGALALALGLAGWGGYQLRGEATAPLTKAANTPIVNQSGHLAPPVDFPEGSVHAPDAVDRALAQIANSQDQAKTSSSRTGD